MTTPRQPMRITYGGAPWAIGANEGPSPDVAAEITLHLAQAAPTRQTTVTRPATPTAVPVPPAAVTSTGRSR